MKTFEELKDIIEDCIDWDDVMYETGSAKYNEAWKELQAAYEKQIPKKPIKRLIMDSTVWFCAECNDVFWSSEHICKKPNFCHNCGQGVDWSDEQ